MKSKRGLFDSLEPTTYIQLNELVRTVCYPDGRPRRLFVIKSTLQTSPVEKDINIQRSTCACGNHVALLLNESWYDQMREQINYDDGIVAHSYAFRGIDVEFVDHWVYAVARGECPITDGLDG